MFASPDRPDQINWGIKQKFYKEDVVMHYASMHPMKLQI